jgi:hypothetical protein
MPIRIRFKYDRAYEANVERIGVLEPALAEKIPLFYTRLNSLLEDWASLGDGTYATADLDTLLRIYRDVHRILQLTVVQGEQLIAMIDKEYPGG